MITNQYVSDYLVLNSIEIVPTVDNRLPIFRCKYRKLSQYFQIIFEKNINYESAITNNRQPSYDNSQIAFRIFFISQESLFQPSHSQYPQWLPHCPTYGRHKEVWYIRSPSNSCGLHSQWIAEVVLLYPFYRSWTITQNVLNISPISYRKLCLSTYSKYNFIFSCMITSM